MLSTDRRPTYDELVEEVRRLSLMLDAWVYKPFVIPPVASGWQCPQCGRWFNGYAHHVCWWSITTTDSTEGLLANG